MKMQHSMVERNQLTDGAYTRSDRAVVVSVVM